MVGMINHLRLALLGSTVALIGCGTGDDLVVDRQTAYAAYEAGLTAFAAKDYPTADGKLTTAIDAHVLNPDFYCFAVAKRAVCWAAAGKYAEASTELDNLGPAAPNQAEIFAARSFILKKQGKLAEANAALAQAKRWDRTIKEF